MSVGNHLRRYGWLLLGLILFGILAANVSWTATWGAIRQLSLLSILILITANLIALLPMFGRWWVILKGQQHDLPFWTVARYTLGGFAISYITPGPQFGGEPYQVLQLQRQHHIPLTEATASVTIEKMLMLFTNLLFLIPGMVLLLQSQLFATADLTWTLLLGGLVVLVLGALLGGWVLNWRPLSRFTHWLPGRWSNAIQQTEAEIAAFCHQRPGTLAWAGFLSCLNWILLAAEYFLMARFLGIAISPTQGIIALTVFRLALLLPIPAGLGAVEGGHIWIFSSMGIEMGAELGLSLSLLIRLRDLLVTLIGLWWASERALRSAK